MRENRPTSLSRGAGFSVLNAVLEASTTYYDDASKYNRRGRRKPQLHHHGRLRGPSVPSEEISVSTALNALGECDRRERPHTWRSEMAELFKEKIYACPFCGSDKVEIARTNKDACWVECAEIQCSARTASAPLRADAIANWNRRAIPQILAIIVDDMDKG